MDYINTFKDLNLTQQLLAKTYKLENRPQNLRLQSLPLNIMEVCGSHTASIYKNGIDKLLPSYINLLSGPGCPVCVTDMGYIDEAILLSQNPNIIIATFGDMLKVPGSLGSLMGEKAKGADIKVVYAPFDCLHIAKMNPDKEVVFIGIGFETTAPAIALTIKEAKKELIHNFSVLLSIKTMPSAMENLIFDESVNISAFICPGHVAAIIGSKPFELLAQKYQVPMVIAGFECLDVLAAIYTLLEMIINKDYSCKNLYKQVVKECGNISALALLDEVFKISDSTWRGLGSIPKTGLSFKPDFSSFNAHLKFNLTLPDVKAVPGCLCSEILKGVKKPSECSLYKTVCTPATPVGACMVSGEGTCMNFYKYNS